MEDFADEIDEDFTLEPDFDPNSELWSAYLTFPRPSKLSDEQMEVYFPDRDGRWSRESKVAITHHGAGGLDLNDNWALAWRGWSCPGCDRPKNEILRLSKRGILLAKLELHHDHIADFVWPHAESLLGKDWRDTAAPGFGEVIGSIQDLAIRFTNCLVCSECNSADGKVKRKYQEEIDSRFSFTTLEIARFVRPQAHCDHDIDFDEALKIWRSARDGFLTRLRLVEQLLTDLENGHLMRERQGTTGARRIWSAIGSAEMLSQAFYREAEGSDRARLLSDLRSVFLARSTSRDSAALPRWPASPNILSPTEAEFASYVDPVSPKRWQATPPDWQCPVCERSKRQVLRKSKKGKWSGGVRQHTGYCDETDAETIEKRRWLFPDFRNEYWVSDAQTTNICSDCAGIGTQVVQGNRSLGKPYLKLQDLRDCLTECGPHQRHEIDINLAQKRIAQNDAYWSAADALNAFNLLLSRFHHKLDCWSQSGARRSDIIADLCEDLRVYNNVTDTADQEALVEWLLKQKEHSNGDA